MNILILGYSDLAQRKLIPTINSLDIFSSYEIASKSKNVEKSKKLTNVYKNYIKAIKTTTAKTVYVSLPNSLHFEISRFALENNKNVIVDKPAVENIDELDYLFELANKNHLFISMSSVFNFHKGWNYFKKMSKPNTSKSEVLIAEFTIPSLNNSNIRLSTKLGGGAIKDMGVYASSIGYLFWEKSVKKSNVEITKFNRLNTGFTLMLNYGPGKTMIGNFGFDQSYKNKIVFSNSNNVRTEYNRVFSQPIDYKSEIIKYVKDKKLREMVGKDNSFANYFNYVHEKGNSNKLLLNKEFKNINLEYLKVFKDV